MAEFTAAQKLACAERELSKRRHVYQRLVASGSMKPREAQWQIDCMAAIAEDYRAAARREKGDLFEGEGR